MALSVLYIHHASAFGGASRSLMELVRGFPENDVAPRLLAPRGNVARIFSEAGVPVMTTAGIAQFDDTRYGHYRGKRWLLLLREAWHLPFNLLGILRAYRRWHDVDLVHVNELVALPSIVLAKKVFRKPVVVHVRSVQCADALRLRHRMVMRVLEKYADAVIAIDETVQRSLPRDLACDVIHNSYSPGPLARQTSRQARRRGNWHAAHRMRVGIVGNLLPLKGIFEFLEAARACRARELEIDFIIVGSNTRQLGGISGWMLKQAGFAQDVEAQVKAFVASQRLEDAVHLRGFTTDIDAVYRDLDVLCFPSHLDAIGRPVFEAAFWHVPSIVAVSNPLPDTMVDRETGLCINAGDPSALADAIEYFYARPAEIERMGEAARNLAAANFNCRRNAACVLEVYRRVLGARGSVERHA